ncbi:olfactory receptor 7E24-like [Oryctolagus cuniculus]|uniref:olfactory receptor 7E24-like n=1 Tax=Oryctolagus cuniculus TaxID=9986 RepID=UPI0038796466
MYLITVLGNLLIILAISSDSHLHTSMYFFLCSLFLANVCFCSSTVPKMIVDVHTHSTVNSYVGGLTQMSLFIIYGCMDDLILTVMAYDQFVTIGHPLPYQIIMNPQHCGFLVSVSVVASLFDSLLHSLMVLQVTCFKDVEISIFSVNLLTFSTSLALTQSPICLFCWHHVGFFPLRDPLLFL